MNEEKKWYQSKTLWGSLVTMGVSIGGSFGVAISPDTQTQVVNIAVMVATAIGGLVSLIGRIKADKKIAKG